jgi:hypothetical protein
MKQTLPTGVVIGVIVVVVLVVAGVGFWIWRAPSVTPAPVTEADRANMMGPRAGGGPTAEDLRKRDEYNRNNPGAAGSGTGSGGSGRSPF